MIALLGGSFDPIHLGHIDIATQFLSQKNASHCYLVPNAQNPLKPHARASAKDRWDMVTLALSEGQHPGISALDWEIFADAPRYTVDLLKQAKTTFAPHDLAFLLGDEAFVDFPKWKNPEGVLKLCRLFVITREHKPETVSQILHEAKIHISLHSQVELWPVKTLPFSSSEIRQQIKSLNSQPQGLSPLVWEHIKKNSLYAV